MTARRGSWQRGAGICLSLLAAPVAWAQAPTIAPSLDRFGGFRPVTLQATGFFRVQKIAERWWLATPDGHPFFSVGVNGIRRRRRRRGYRSPRDQTAPPERLGTSDWAQRLGTAIGDERLGTGYRSPRDQTAPPVAVAMRGSERRSLPGERQELGTGYAAPAAEAEARTGRDPFLLTVGRRVRYWSDGALIGPELFVREMAAKLIDAKRALRKRPAPGLSPGRAGDPPALFAYRRLPALD